jgi:hypothetical protein
LPIEIELLDASKVATLEEVEVVIPKIIPLLHRDS